MQINKLEEIVFHVHLPDIEKEKGIICAEGLQLSLIDDKLLDLINKAVREVSHIIRHSLYFNIKPFMEGIYKNALEQKTLSLQFLFTVYSSFRREIGNIVPGIKGIETEINERNRFGMGIYFNENDAFQLLSDMIENGIEGYKALKHGAVAGGRLEAIKEYTDMHFTESLTLESLASQFFISKQYLANRFKALTGATVNGYIHQKRLIKAKEMLLSSEVQVSDIATLVGYNSISHFNKLFRREFNLTPTEFRDRNITSS